LPRLSCGFDRKKECVEVPVAHDAFERAGGGFERWGPFRFWQIGEQLLTEEGGCEGFGGHVVRTFGRGGRDLCHGRGERKGRGSQIATNWRAHEPGREKGGKMREPRSVGRAWCARG